MRKGIVFLLFFCLSLNLFPSVEPTDDFKKGFAFLLLKKIEMAKKILEPWISVQKSPNLKEAFTALLDGDRLLASSKFESFLDQDVRNVEALLGYCLSLESYPVYSEHYFRQALKINRNLSIGRIALGYALRNQEKFKDAEREILLALRKDNFPVYKYFLFDLYLNLESWEKALKVCNELSPAFPEDWTIPLRMGRLLVSKGIKEKGLEFLIKASEINPSSTDLLVEIGTVLTKEGKSSEAIKYFDKAYSINKKDMNVIKGRGFVLLEKGDFVNAYKQLMPAWKKKQEDYELSFLLGKACYYMGKEEEGKEWILRAVLNGFKDWAEIQKIPSLGELKTREKILSFLGLYSIPFYQVDKMEFLSSEKIVLIGKKRKGEPTSLFLLDSDGKNLKKVTLNENVKDFLVDGENLIIKTSDKDGIRHNIYLLEKLE